jgi:hypothetical protein
VEKFRDRQVRNLARKSKEFPGELNFCPDQCTLNFL